MTTSLIVKWESFRVWLTEENVIHPCLSFKICLFLGLDVMPDLIPFYRGVRFLSYTAKRKSPRMLRTVVRALKIKISFFTVRVANVTFNFELPNNFVYLLKPNIMLEEITNTILNGMKLSDCIAYCLLAIAGQILSYAFEIYKHWKPIRTQGGFSLPCWITENTPRVMISIIFTPVLVIMGGGLMNWALALTTGLGMDSAIDALFKRKA